MVNPETPDRGRDDLPEQDPPARAMDLQAFAKAAAGLMKRTPAV